MLANRLDFAEKMPRKIFVGYLDSAQMAFILAEDNPYCD